MSKTNLMNISTLGLLLLSSCLVLLQQTQSQSSLAQAQDLLRNNRHQHSTGQRPSVGANPLANIQLPPQLASLTPQQLHHLAQLRELQLQQQAQQQQQQQQQQQVSSAPPPLGLEQLPTAQPAGSNSAQIPQPIAANSAPESNDRHDDGSYNEASSEMEGVAPASASSSQSQDSASGNQAAASSAGSDGSLPAGNQQQPDNNNQQQAAPQAPSFEVNWNKCPQLEPGEGEKNKKTQVITKCLQSAPIPANLTRESVEAHREQIATCALGVEGWFDDKGNYKYDKAEMEIRAKKLEPTIENQVLKFHIACKDEASKKFPRDQNKLIDQVQFYQACMDYYISIVCEIEVSVDQ